MKKLLLLAVIAMAVVSCRKDCDCRGDELYMYSQDFEVYSEDWTLHQTDDEAYYFYTFDNVTRLTELLGKQGQVTATRYEGNRQSPLGETRHFKDGVEWTETIRMDYEPGYRNEPGQITFIVSYSDYETYTPDFKPPYMKFRVVMNW